MVDDILDIIEEYCEKYNINLENFCEEQIYQNDERSIAAMDYFTRILGVCVP